MGQLEMTALPLTLIMLGFIGIAHIVHITGKEAQ